MQAEDVRALRQCAVPTAVAGALCTVAGSVTGGGKGALGALFALAVVAIFFIIDFFVFARAAKAGPHALMPAAMGTYLVKIIALAVLADRLRDTTLFNGRVFGLTAIACIIVWSAAQVRVWVKAKTFYVETAGKL